jgi:hypothetical protein
MISLLYDFSKCPHNLYIGSSINDVEINLQTYKINSQKVLKIKEKKSAELEQLLERYSTELYYRVKTVNKSSNKLVNVLSDFCGIKIDAEFYAFQYSCIETSNECYQIDLHRIYKITI